MGKIKKEEEEEEEQGRIDKLYFKKWITCLIMFIICHLGVVNLARGDHQEIGIHMKFVLEWLSQ